MDNMRRLVLLKQLLGLLCVPACPNIQSDRGWSRVIHLKTYLRSASDDPTKNHSSPSCFPKGEFAGSVSITYLMPCPTRPVPPVTRTLTDIVGDLADNRGGGLRRNGRRGGGASQSGDLLMYEQLWASTIVIKLAFQLLSHLLLRSPSHPPPDRRALNCMAISLRSLIQCAGCAECSTITPSARYGGQRGSTATRSCAARFRSRDERRTYSMCFNHYCRHRLGDPCGQVARISEES